MDKWLKASLVAAPLFAGAGALSFHYLAFVQPGETAASRADEITVAHGRGAVVNCQEAARMVYDVHWAAACMAHANQAGTGNSDGHPECDLPDARAAVVNAWLNEAERRCTAEPR